MREQAVGVLGVFPGLGNEAVGGVQSSGDEALRGLVGQLGEQHAQVFRYEPATSKLATVIRAIRCRKTGKVILVWHLDLLKLVPFFRQAGSRVALFLHGTEAWRRQDRATQLLLPRVHVMLSNSAHTWTRFVESNPGSRGVPHTVVHLGAGSPLNEALAVDMDRSAVLMVGRLDAREDYKGHREMITAWPAVVGRIPGAQLSIAGDGDLRPELERLARETGAGDAVKFLGRISEAEKEMRLSKCRCLAMPSRGEGFGLVYIEAMRMGRPCLVSTFDAGREVVNPPEAGLAVDPDNQQQVADAVVRLLTPGSEWDAWSAQARARYESHFTAAHFHQRLATALLGDDAVPRQ